jgi:NAD(P)-dependent dehydrogenase (short-subunit alcohol dehydrogenase family)
MSNSEPTQRIVITGSSSGFGLLTAKSLLTLGYEVVATMRDSATRKPSKAAELRAFSADTRRPADPSTPGEYLKHQPVLGADYGRHRLPSGTALGWLLHRDRHAAGRTAR